MNDKSFESLLESEEEEYVSRSSGRRSKQVDSDYSHKSVR